jgi:hypothetical protein
MKFFSHIIGHMVAVLPMAIADCKEMKTLDTIEIRSKNEAILVLLVWVAWNEAYCCRKSKFCYNIVPSRILFRRLRIILISFCSLLSRLLSAGPATIRRLPYLLLIGERWRLLSRSYSCPLSTITSVLCNRRVVVAEESLLFGALIFKQASASPSWECLEVMYRTHGLSGADRSNLSVIR